MKYYPNDETGGTSAIWCASLNPSGILNFGSGGLIKFDGERWTKYPTPEAVELRSMDQGPDGRLWVGGFNELGWFQDDPNGRPNYHSLAKYLPKRQNLEVGLVWHVYADKEGAVFLTGDQVLRWNGAKFDSWEFPGARRLAGWRSGGTVYFSHKPTGVYAMRANGPELVIPAAALGTASAGLIEPVDDGYLVVTNEGLFKYSHGKAEPFAPEQSELWRKNLSSVAMRLPDGRLAIGTLQSGLVLARADGSIEQIISDKNGLPFRSVYSLFLDREGGLWLTSTAGVARLTLDSSTAIFGQLEGLPEQPVEQIVRHAGKIVAVTPGGLLEFDSGAQRFQFVDRTGRYSRIQELRSTPLGLFAADYGAVRIFNDWKPTDLLVNGRDNYALGQLRSAPDSILAVTDRSLLLLSPHHESKTLVRDINGMGQSMAEDNQGRLWIGTFANGTLVAQLNSTQAVEATRPGPEFGLFDVPGWGVVAGTPNGSVLNFTPTGGWVKTPAANSFSPIDNYPTWPTSRLAVSDATSDGDIWVVRDGPSNRTSVAGRIHFLGDKAVWQPHSIEGLEKIGLLRTVFVEDGPGHSTDLWIGGDKGILRTRVSSVGPTAPKPPAPLLKILARSGDSNEQRPITEALPYSTRSIIYEFAEPVYGLRPQLRLETKLDGVDHDWVPADTTSRRELNALRDGRYTFHVRAVAETGVTSDETTFGFVINPPWWRTNTAILGGLLALGGAGYGAYYWRMRALRRRNAVLEAKVAERTLQLTQASAAKSQFLANMSHDIRNPLNGIVGLALALEDTALDAKQFELVTTLRECTSYLSTLVDDVLDFASIEAGRVELRPGPFSPNELLRSIATTMRTEAGTSGATLVVDVDPLLPTTYVGDAGRIQQILVNYVSNALKYAGGQIKITASFCPDAPGEIEFAVHDEGPGISAEEQKILFTKFTRLTGSHAREIAGSGLGLASCRLLANLMGGSVGVQSEPGHGALFFLRLPLESRADSAVPMDLPLPDCTVLLVEDTNYNAIAASAVLGKLGLHCDRARNGAEALEKFSQKRYNLVLLDRNLPDMDGTEVARKIRSLEGDGPRSILLAVTAYCTAEDRAQCLGAGMDAFVGKPLTPEKLRRVLIAAGRRHLAAASMHVAPQKKTDGVDVSLLEYISDGTGTGLGQQIDLFLAALEEAERQLDAAARSLELPRLGNAAHAVLSHARLVGNAALAEAATAVEDNARAGDNRAFGAALKQLQREIGDLKVAMRRHPAAVR